MPAPTKACIICGEKASLRCSLLALLALAAAAPLPAPRTNSTTGLRPGCVPGWKFAPRRYDWPAGGAPGHAGHWSSRCGYRHTTLHRCGAPLPSAYDCADASVWTQAPPASVDGVPAGPAATTVSLTYGGQLGNNMFQYAFAYRLAVEIAARRDRPVRLAAPRAPGEGAAGLWAGMRSRLVGAPAGTGARRRLAGRGRGPGAPTACANVVTDRDATATVPLCAQLRRALAGPACVAVDGFFEDFGSLRGWRDVFQRLYAPPACPAPAPAPGDVIVHVRECGNSDVDRPRPFFSAHGQVPWRFYDKILASVRGRVVVLAPPACARSALVARLKARFGATHRAASAADDYCALLRARTVVLAPSTFSWWAAWLSNATVHVPLLGLLAHQRTTNYPHRPGAARRRGGLTCESLFGGAGKSLVVDDPRYVYHDVEGGRWFGAYHRANESFLFLNVT